VTEFWVIGRNMDEVGSAGGAGKKMGRYLREILEKYTKTVVWGTGDFYAQYRELFAHQFAYFVDNDVKKWGCFLDGKEICPPEKLADEDDKNTLVIVCNHYFEEISNQIKQYGKFSLIDIVTMGLLNEKERNVTAQKPMKADRLVAVYGGIHAMWQTNGSRRFIEGQCAQIRRANFYTIEMIPLLFYEEGRQDSVYLALSADGCYFGIFSVYEFVEMYPRVRGFVIHSPYYSHGTVKVLLDSIAVEKSILYYIHDFSCICFYRFLHKNQELCIDENGKFCCSSCSEKCRRRKRVDFYRALFEKYRALLAAPSADTKKKAEQFYRNVKIVELPHLEYETETFQKSVNSRIRIAYIGAAIWHKGWEPYVRLVERFHQKYDFYCMGDCPERLRIPDVTYVSVGLYGYQGMPSMTEALTAHGIDIAYIGSLWAETYSYTYYEAYEAGCFIITNTRSGNVCSQVRQNGNGLVFSDEDEMADWLETEKVGRDVQNMNKRIKNVRDSGKFLSYLE
jgi:hypothetical protein